MKCPNCNETLLMSERQSVEIDYCPSCRGVWLDKGELDKLLQFASEQNAAPNYEQKQQRDVTPQYGNHDGYYQDKGKYQQHPRKKRSFLADIFDFD